jgi:serpin B
VPTHSADINALIGEITPETWDDWMGRFQTREINVEVPRFTLEYEQVLNNVLGALGMEIAFGGGADFSRITASGGLSIDEVRHKTFLEVNEEGTEAAAVTSVSMIRMGPPSVVCNRPFIFAIRENHSGTILFIGKMMDPPVEE